MIRFTQMRMARIFESDRPRKTEHPMKRGYGPTSRPRGLSRAPRRCSRWHLPYSAVSANAGRGTYIEMGYSKQVIAGLAFETPFAKDPRIAGIGRTL